MSRYSKFFTGKKAAPSKKKIIIIGSVLTMLLMVSPVSTSNVISNFTSIEVNAAIGPGQALTTGAWEATQVGVDIQGAPINTWKYKENGVYITGWKEVLGKWYYMGADGVMLASCVVDGYTLGSDGAMITQNGSVSGDIQVGLKNETSAKTPTEQTTPNKATTPEKEESTEEKVEKQIPNTDSVMDWLGSDTSSREGESSEHLLTIKFN